MPTPAVAISACLHGDPVRYDGTAKSLENTLDKLHKYLRLMPICPEVGAGMAVPRPPVQLQTDRFGEIRVIGRDNRSLDVTQVLRDFSANSLARAGQGLCGYITKSRSPSCGFKTTPVFNGNGEQQGVTSGVQIGLFHAEMPWLQIIDEIDLAEPASCDSFIVRCLIMADIRLHCGKPGLPTIHRHYADVIREMPRSYRDMLDTLLGKGDAGGYWRSFGTGLQAAAERP